MRDIKFRAWFKEENRMIEWEQLHLEHDDCGLMAWIGEDGDNFGTASGYPIDDFELMQYTGLKDKNGKEIYEGDIVKCYAKETWAIKTGIASKLILYETGEVAWFEEECGFGIKGQDPTFLGWYECFEVIGNIYENPELLK